jgi:oxygen-dependent protoporphyrinogen oxidase
MEVLIRALVEGLGERVATGVEVDALEPDGDGWVVRGSRDGTELSWRAPEVVLAVPAFAAAGLLAPRFPRLGSLLAEIPYAGISVACLIYDRDQVQHPLDGFGFLVPRGQGLRMLGCLWSGSIFPSHVPGDKVLLRVMLGGARDPEGALLNEAKTVELAHQELIRTLGRIEGRPREVRLYRHPRGIPQYVQGHPQRLCALEKEIARAPGLHLAGNAYRGIGVNDCVRTARELAARLGTGERGAPGTAPSLTGGTSR